MQSKRIGDYPCLALHNACCHCVGPVALALLSCANCLPTHQQQLAMHIALSTSVMAPGLCLTTLTRGSSLWKSLWLCASPVALHLLWTYTAGRQDPWCGDGALLLIVAQAMRIDFTASVVVR